MRIVLPDGSSWQQDSPILQRSNRRPTAATCRSKNARCSAIGAGAPLAVAGDQHPHRFEHDRQMVLEFAAIPAGARARARRASRGSPRAAAPTAGRGSARRRGSPRSCPTPTKSVWYSSRDGLGSPSPALAARSASHAGAAMPPAVVLGVPRRGASGGAPAMRREQRRVGRVGEEPREQRVEIGARLVLGRESATQRSTAPQTSRMSTPRSFFMRSMTRQSAHILSRSSAPGAANIECPASFAEHAGDHLLGAERLAARRCT